MFKNNERLFIKLIIRNINVLLNKLRSKDYKRINILLNIYKTRRTIRIS